MSMIWTAFAASVMLAAFTTSSAVATIWFVICKTRVGVTDENDVACSTEEGQIL